VNEINILHIAAVPLSGLNHTSAVVLDNVTCVGSELDLLRCNHSGIHQHSCGLSEESAAGVMCAGLSRGVT